MYHRRVFLIRHGETEGESSIRYHGRNDVALSALGREQVARLVPWLRDERFAAVVHSPLSRAVASAQVLVDGLAAPPAVVEVHDGLAEVHFGALEGLTEEEIRARMPEWYAEWKAGRVDGYPGGETHAGFAARIAAAWDEMLARHPEGDLLVVAHRGVIRRALVHALRLPSERGRDLVIDLASLTIVGHGPAGHELLELDRVP
jgi:broad specificity phosphatase PhoE